ncbi:MAG: ATP synthase F1 subunit epsilon [Oscillospiraceae bacterium]|nr:ATP synthase F1 subunit epsilon [Oscillospiraceae bacterium]MCL2279620.1 ATP synthase F1 subunit epsilon [Oscillospiraceae bacterium]
MPAEKLHLRIATPDTVKYDEKTEMVIMRCISGDMGILANHEPTSAILDYGVLRIINGEVERHMAVFGGIAQIGDNKVTILANDAQWPEDIDLALAESERERLERRSIEDMDDLALAKDQVLMRRTLVQIEVSTFPLISRTDREEDKDG